MGRWLLGPLAGRLIKPALLIRSPKAIAMAVPVATTFFTTPHRASIDDSWPTV